jgi:hypothetical protein
VLAELMDAEVTTLAGPQGKHNGRSHRGAASDVAAGR